MEGTVVAGKEREHSVEHRPHFINLVGLVHGLVCLIHQVQETPQFDEAVMFHDFPESGDAGLGLLDLLGSNDCFVPQKPPEIGIKEQLEEGKCGALVVDVVWDVFGAYIVSKELCVYQGDSL